MQFTYSSSAALLDSAAELARLSKNVEMKMMAERERAMEAEDMATIEAKGIRGVKMNLDEIKDKLDVFDKELEDFDGQKRKLERFFTSLLSDHRKAFLKCSKPQVKERNNLMLPLGFTEEKRTQLPVSKTSTVCSSCGQDS